MPASHVPILPDQLPPGYVARPAVLADAGAATGLCNAYNIALIGQPALQPGELASEWQTPTFTLATDTQTVWAPDDTLVGLAEMWGAHPYANNFVFAVVHPQHQGLGIGTALAGWAEARGQQRVSKAPDDIRVVVRQFKLSTDESATRLLGGLGWEIARRNLRMVIDFDGPPPAPTLPEGLVIRPFIRGKEERALLLAIREEFRDHWGHVEIALEDDYREWLHYLDTSPTADPELFFVAVDRNAAGEDEIAGTAFAQTAWAEDPESGWISALGVRRPWRRRGLALALLQHCFAAIYARGKRRAGLGVDAQSLTGATRLYEKAGMHMQLVYLLHEKELRPGRDLSTRSVA